MKTLLTLISMAILSYIANFVLSFMWALPCEVREITSQAMLPTLRVQDLVFVEKISPYFNQAFKRGEIVLFYPEFLNSKEKNSLQKALLALARIKGQTGETAHLRRVAGLPGDLVEIYCAQAKIVLPPNISTDQMVPKAGGEVIKIVCSKKDIAISNQRCMGRFLIPQGYLFLIGDNTEYLGILEDVKIFGRPQFRFSDFSKIEAQGTNCFVISKEEQSQ